MRRFDKSAELLWLMGIVFVALGVSLCSKADLGVSMLAAPAFILSEFLRQFFPHFSVGACEYAIQGLLLVFLCFIIRRVDWRFLLAFAVAVIYGFTLDFFLWLFSALQPASLVFRWILLILGDIITAFGVACFFRSYLPLQVYELFVAELSRSFHFSLSKTKWCFDISLFIVSLLLALSLFADAGSFDWTQLARHAYHSIGLGTVFTTVINSPLIAMAGFFIDGLFVPEPRFPRLERFLGRKA